MRIAHNSKLKIQNSKFKTQNSKLKIFFNQTLVAFSDILGIYTCSVSFNAYLCNQYMKRV